jgi:hypothetical protein|tara:strand:+ start:318 stop:593 length:276 start_codon:yes stop_codon:yes gene_type:complete
MKGPMYDFTIAYISVLLTLTLLSIKEVRNEIKHILYVFYLCLTNVTLKIKNYGTDCFCGKKPNETPNPISEIDFNQFELSNQVDETRYIEL